jgi:phytanoyl-CoA hydroxylase
MPQVLRKLTIEQKREFEREGYLVVQGLFKPDELAEIEDTFEQISSQTIPVYFEPDLNLETTDPLKRYPRVMHPHRFNLTAQKYMLHPDVLAVLEDLYEEPALAAQSMFYYKPPGARGQALHQDNFYLLVEPGNCIAAWTAVDAADEENGSLLVVPQTNNEAIVCPELADSNESFTNHLVKVPEGKKAVPAIMVKGDVLFFNGNLIHGSYRNKSKDRFRRAFICHYTGESTTRIGQHYNPLYRADGTIVKLENNPDSGPCGVEFDTVYPH